MIQHLAVIMDGNRRWAKTHKLDLVLGHKMGGIEAARRTIAFCLKHKIPTLSLYVFSLENFKRSEYEKNFLFSLLKDESKQLLKECMLYSIKIECIGELSLFPQDFQTVCDNLEEQTKNHTQLRLILLLGYGGQQEIFRAAQKFAIQSLEKKRDPHLLSQEDFEACLSTHALERPEIIIRTGGVKRLSNFLLYQAAYSECYFLDCLWPDIQESDFEYVLNNFFKTQRNFGK